MSKKETRVKELKKLAKKLPYGSKAQIARRIGETRQNVQCAFVGEAGEELTKNVFREAKKMLKRTKVKRMVINKPVFVK